MHAKHASLKAQRHGRTYAARARPIKHAIASRHSRSPGDNVANRLNQQEMQRMSGSGMSQQPQSGAQPMYQGR